MRDTPEIWTKYRKTLDQIKNQLAGKPDINRTLSDIREMESDDQLRALQDFLGIGNKKQQRRFV